MTPLNQSSNARFILTTVSVCTVLAIALLATLPQPAQALPPRPTVPSGPEEDSSAVGAQIQLQAQFPKNWPWETTHWQDLWTLVQWQDAHGEWHDVEGWQGTLDTVEIDAVGTVAGHKTWWVGEENMGEGPLRWRVYQGQDSPLLATSEPFYLPSASKTTLEVKVTLP
jgi:hypothetical protein